MDVEIKIGLSGDAPQEVEECVRRIMLLIAAKLIEASVKPNGEPQRPTRG